MGLKYFELTEAILKSCFEVMNDLGIGFLESVYKNSLFVSLREKGLEIIIEKSFVIFFHEKKVGHYIADLIVNNTVVIELKCVENLLPEHQAQTINYLKASNLPIGLLVNFGKPKLQFKRLFHPLFNSFPSHPSYPVHPVPSLSSDPVGAE